MKEFLVGCYIATIFAPCAHVLFKSIIIIMKLYVISVINVCIAAYMH